MTRIKGQLTTADYLPIEDFNRLTESLHNDRLFLWELYCRLSFCTALRASDVRSLKWKDFLNKERLERNEIKTGKTRKIIFHHSVREKLSELYELLGKPDPNNFAILNPRTGKAYSLEYINRKLKTFRVKYRLPIKAFSSHTFRKTFGRYVYESNNKSAESLILLSSIFRHSSIETTKIYIGLRQEEINGVYNSIQF
ncbi:MAG: tyrosine-type recombinase/integrase [Prevotella sp.]|jgi:integrase|nr:tyrosine-type recombinase/integrase [Prevotella sp.]